MSILRLAGIFFCSLIGWAHTTLTIELPARVVLETYAGSGEQVSAQMIDARDQRYLKLKSFIADEESGWIPSLTTYVPAPFIYKWGGGEIDCYPDFAVVHISEKSGLSDEYVKEIPKLDILLNPA